MIERIHIIRPDGTIRTFVDCPPGCQSVIYRVTENSTAVKERAASIRSMFHSFDCPLHEKEYRGRAAFEDAEPNEAARRAALALFPCATCSPDWT